MKKKTIIIIFSIMAIIAGLYLGIQAIFGKKALNYQIIEVVRGEIIQKVSATGTVVPAEKIDLQFENNGKIERIEVKVGDRVSQGQLLVKLNTAELTSQLQTGLAALDITKAQLAQVLAGSRPEEINIYETAVANAQIEVANKEGELANTQTDAENSLNYAYQNGLNALQTVYTAGDKALLKTIFNLRQKYFNNYSEQTSISVREAEEIAKNDLSLAKTYLDQAQITTRHSQIDLGLTQMTKALNSIRNGLAIMRSAMETPLYQDQVSAADRTLVDSERISIDNAITLLSSNEQTISSTKINNQAELDRAEAALDSAKANLRTAENQLALKKAGPRQSEIDLAQAQVRQAQANVSQISQRLDKSFLRAPVDGLITDITKNEGEIASLSQSIVSMNASSAFQIETNISETEIAKISLNDKAEMTLDALGPDEKFSGSVIKIDPAETVLSGVIYYKITAVFDSQDERVKPGMTVNLEIETAKKENILRLPYYALKEKDGQKYVLVLEGETLKEKLVKTGLEGENDVEIVEGLNEGERITVEK